MSELEQELYRALIIALDHLEGEPRLLAIKAIEKAETPVSSETIDARHGDA
jgi:hypothetical protein